MKAVKFIKHPGGTNLAYHPGEEGLVNDKLANELIAEGICESLEKEADPIIEGSVENKPLAEILDSETQVQPISKRKMFQKTKRNSKNEA